MMPMKNCFQLFDSLGGNKNFQKILWAKTSCVVTAKKLQKKLWEEMGHLKPNALDKDKERQLKRTATQ